MIWLTCGILAGFPVRTIRQHKRWARLFQAILEAPIPEVKRVDFKPKFPNIPVLGNYAQPPGAEFWENFPANYVKPKKALVDPVKLQELANELKLANKERLRLVVEDAKFGARIGCSGEARLPTRSCNAPSAFKAGRQVTDAIASWIDKGFAYGPVNREDVPSSAKISGLMAREKPDGAVRVILNLSSPKGRSVNDGINSEDFPATMSSTKAWVTVLHKAGRGALICKVDWAHAYKHIAVHADDLDLQWFCWLGKFFMELCLVFGCGSAAGLYDRNAKTVLELVLLASSFPPDMVCQHLDDVCAAAPAGASSIYCFDEAYKRICTEVGVKLAPRDDPEKSFAPCTEGVVLGVHYDTCQWTWGLPQGKLIRLVRQIREAIAASSIPAKEMWSLTGRILHIRPLIPTGKYNVAHILEANKVKEGGAVFPTPALLRQLHFWDLVVRACSSNCAIPPPEVGPQPWALDIHTDAAGGSSSYIGAGSGGVLASSWFYLPWTPNINKGKIEADGKKFGRNLSALELIGPLVALTVFAEKIRTKHVRIWVDNDGSVDIWEKGYSNSCPICSSIVANMAAVAAALGVTLHLCKVQRCSALGPVLADKLSKAKFSEFRLQASLGGLTMDSEPRRPPAAITRWLADPRVDDDLAEKILRELSRSTILLGYSAMP